MCTEKFRFALAYGSILPISSSGAKTVYTKEASLELFKNVAPKYKGEKTSGFTRIIPIKYRDGDNAKLVKLELV
jgi:ribosomal protein L17